MNAFTLKTLLLSVITEIKFGQPLAANASTAKKKFKELAGLRKGATNKEVLAELKRTYTENGLADDFEGTLTRMKATDLLPA